MFDTVSCIMGQKAGGGSGGSGGGVFWVTFTWDDDTGTCIADKSFDEIQSALSAGQMVSGIYVNSYDGNQIVAPLACTNDAHVFFSAVAYSINGANCDQFDVAADGTVTWTAWTWPVEED